MSTSDTKFPVHQDAEASFIHKQADHPELHIIRTLFFFTTQISIYGSIV